jgi:hypothetical protein
VEPIETLSPLVAVVPPVAFKVATLVHCANSLLLNSEQIAINATIIKLRVCLSGSVEIFLIISFEVLEKEK